MTDRLRVEPELVERFVGLAAPGIPLARVAVEAGYADQAHMSRDTQALAGVTPAALRPD